MSDTALDAHSQHSSVEEQLSPEAAQPEAVASSPQNGNAEEEFTLFPRLPFELRNLIWEFTIPDLEPRAVILVISQPCTSWRLHGMTKPGKQHLLTCQESAAVFKKSYELMTLEELEPLVPNSENHETSPKAKHVLGYFDTSRDILVVSFSSLEDMSACGVKISLWSRIRHLGLICMPVPRGPFALQTDPSPFSSIPSSFPSLVSISCIQWGSYLDYGNALKLVEIDKEINTSKWKYFEHDEPRPQGYHLRETEGQVNIPKFSAFLDWRRFCEDQKRRWDSGIEFKVAMLAREVIFDPDDFKALLRNGAPSQFYSYLYIDKLGCSIGYRSGDVRTKITPRMKTRDSFEKWSREKFF